MTEENEIYKEPSPATVAYRAHVEALAPLADLPVGKCFVVPSEGLQLGLLRDLVEKASSGASSIVVIEHKNYNVFEVQRLPDGYSTKLFYKHFAVESNPNLTEDEVKRICAEYLESTFEKCLKYDSKLTFDIKAARIISHVYLQLRTASLVAFKNSKLGATKELRNVINLLTESGYFCKIEDNDKNKFDGYKGNLYQIL